MPDSFRQMILCPELADFTLTPCELQTVLTQLGLIGDAIDTSGETTRDTTEAPRFYVGVHFLQHISFMGCAPAIEFVPPDDEQTHTGETEASTHWHQFTYIVLPQPFNKPVWQADLEMAKPACPECGKRIPRPAEYIEGSAVSLSCPHCQSQASVCEYNWREFGGCAKTMFSIVYVYPKEAIPSSNLLNRLEEHTKVSWRYFYINGPLPQFYCTI